MKPSISLLLGACVCLMACSQTAIQTISRVTGVERAKAPVPDIRSRLTPNALAKLDGPILIIELPDRGSEAGAQLIVRSRGQEIWATNNGITLSFQNGILSSTRGLGGDLMSSDLTEVNQALHQRRGDAVRVLQYLDGEDHTVTRGFVCTYSRETGLVTQTLTGSFRTTRVDETCTSLDETIENKFWIDQAGVTRKSRQWVGPFVGYLLTERINDV